ncbi:helix-turn-helix domain-containing protein [Streptomyces griseomycini]|uniref:Insertion element IS150 protein InsJ-like helix-turn-helix domain-containing protein n=2 Tax=Streptomyces griseomycini TaxID=66895 RepID=A0A7W7M053_9ACTN|nr:helix-turn-helix domain-containing protein [Streptomyces griseomycini]MBB4899242.1 hypothetical protein [Streptomyces griseomycini]GGR35009.1 hypothetical protein GCM10015536_45700 [Streptomyces griseomycini]
MAGSSWQRPLVLAMASAALAAGTTYAVQAAQSTPAGSSHSTDTRHPPGHHADCGKGGKGGEGGKGGAPGRPGEPGRPGCFRPGDLLPDKPEGSKPTGADKIRIVMAVMSGHTTSAQAAEKYDIPQDEIDTWKRQFLDGDWLTLLAEHSGEDSGGNGRGTFPFSP